MGLAFAALHARDLRQDNGKIDLSRRQDFESGPRGGHARAGMGCAPAMFQAGAPCFVMAATGPFAPRRREFRNAGSG
jgi:hypothetical protein